MLQLPLGITILIRLKTYSTTWKLEPGYYKAKLINADYDYYYNFYHYCFLIGDKIEWMMGDGSDFIPYNKVTALLILGRYEDDETTE